MIIITIISIIGVILNIYKRRECFAVWIITNGSWAIYDFSIGAWEQGILFTVYFTLAIWGLLAWKKNKNSA